MAMHTLRLFACRLVGLAMLLALAGGCQSGPPVSSQRLIEHQAMIDFAGLGAEHGIKSIKTTLATPVRWEQPKPKLTALYTLLQWRAPSGHTGIGVVYAQLPLPLSAKMVVWLAKQEYSKGRPSGRVLGEWQDALGRSWFEAENDKYHIRGYVLVKGFDAWIVSFGYKTQYPPDVAEISLAARSAETAVPMLDDSAPATQPARGD
jgi:hypothetical protein